MIKGKEVIELRKRIKRRKPRKRLRIKRVFGIGMAATLLLFGCSVLGSINQPSIADTASHLEHRIAQTESADSYFNNLSGLVYTMSDKLSDENNTELFSTAISNLPDKTRVEIIYRQIGTLNDDDLEHILYSGFDNLDTQHREEFLLDCYEEMDYSSKQRLVSEELSNLDRGQRLSVLRDCSFELIGDYYQDLIERFKGE